MNKDLMKELKGYSVAGKLVGGVIVYTAKKQGAKLHFSVDLGTKTAVVVEEGVVEPTSVVEEELFPWGTMISDNHRRHREEQARRYAELEKENRRRLLKREVLDFFGLV